MTPPDSGERAARYPLLKNPPPWPKRPGPCWHYCKDGGFCARHGHCIAICACTSPALAAELRARVEGK